MTDLPGLADNFMERRAVRGKRRAAEMRKVAKTLEELGLSNFLPVVTARHQDMVAEMKIAETFDGKVPHDRAFLARAMRLGQSVD